MTSEASLQYYSERPLRVECFHNIPKSYCLACVVINEHLAFFLFFTFFVAAVVVAGCILPKLFFIGEKVPSIYTLDNNE